MWLQLDSLDLGRVVELQDAETLQSFIPALLAAPLDPAVVGKASDAQLAKLLGLFQLVAGFLLNEQAVLGAALERASNRCVALERDNARLAGRKTQASHGCGYCKKAFVSLDALQGHLQRRHGVAAAPSPAPSDSSLSARSPFDSPSPPTSPASSLFSDDEPSLLERHLVARPGGARRGEGDAARRLRRVADREEQRLRDLVDRLQAQLQKLVPDPAAAPAVAPAPAVDEARGRELDQREAALERRERALEEQQADLARKTLEVAARAAELDSSAEGVAEAARLREEAFRVSQLQRVSRAWRSRALRAAFVHLRLAAAAASSSSSSSSTAARGGTPPRPLTPARSTPLSPIRDLPPSAPAPASPAKAPTPPTPAAAEAAEAAVEDRRETDTAEERILRLLQGDNEPARPDPMAQMEERVARETDLLWARLTAAGGDMPGHEPLPAAHEGRGSSVTFPFLLSRYEHSADAVAAAVAAERGRLALSVAQFGDAPDAAAQQRRARALREQLAQRPDGVIAEMGKVAEELAGLVAEHYSDDALATAAGGAKAAVDEPPSADAVLDRLFAASAQRELDQLRARRKEAAQQDMAGPSLGSIGASMLIPSPSPSRAQTGSGSPTADPLAATQPVNAAAGFSGRQLLAPTSSSGEGDRWGSPSATLEAPTATSYDAGRSAESVDVTPSQSRFLPAVAEQPTATSYDAGRSAESLDVSPSQSRLLPSQQQPTVTSYTAGRSLDLSPSQLSSSPSQALTEPAVSSSQSQLSSSPSQALTEPSRVVVVGSRKSTEPSRRAAAEEEPVVVSRSGPVTVRPRRASLSAPVEPQEAPLESPSRRHSDTGGVPTAMPSPALSAAEDPDDLDVETIL